MAQKAVTAKTLRRKAVGEISDSTVPNLRWHIGKRRVSAFTSPWIKREGGEAKQRKIRVLSFPKALSEDETARKMVEAREQVAKILADAAAGIDPEERARLDKRAARKERQQTADAVYDEYMMVHGNALGTAEELRRKWTKYMRPALDGGTRPIREVTREDLKEILFARHAEAPTQARRLRSLIRGVWKYADDEDYIEMDISARLKLPSKDARRTRKLDDAEIASAWRGIEQSKMALQKKLVLKACLVLMQRRNEVALMHWREITASENYWEIPGERTKSGRATRVPLTDLAWSLIREAGTTSGYVFAYADGTPPSGASISQAMKNCQAQLGLKDRATVHDLRRTAASCMGDLGIDRVVIRKLLNHREEGVTGEVYDLADRWSQKVPAMQAWSDKLVEITTGQAPPSNVRRLREAGHAN